MKFGMIIDLNLCSSCGACALACKAENNTRTRGEGQSFNWADFLQETKGTFPNSTQIAIPVMCNHCENPQCVKVCPTGAMFISPEGVVLHNDEVCIGCRLCQKACPYSSAELGPESLDGKSYSVISFNPKGVDPRGDAATRPVLIEGVTGGALELAVPCVYSWSKRTALLAKSSSRFSAAFLKTCSSLSSCSGSNKPRRIRLSGVVCIVYLDCRKRLQPLPNYLVILWERTVRHRRL